jgi:ABC-type branched-subunit amino acid transport system substrate-binding protein
MGLKAEVFVHDTKTDTVSLKKVLSKPEFKGIDLIIGPLTADNVDYVGKWCKQNGVRMVCPVTANPAMLKDNPFVYQAIPSDVTLMEGLAKYILDEHTTEQIVLVKPASEKDKINYEAFRSAYLSLPYKGSRPKLIEAGVDNYATFLKRGMNTVFIFPTSDKSAANKFHNGLNVETEKQKESSSIYVYGTKDWLNFEDLALYKAFYSFGYCSPNDFKSSHYIKSIDWNTNQI